MSLVNTSHISIFLCLMEFVVFTLDISHVGRERFSKNFNSTCDELLHDKRLVQ